MLHLRHDLERHIHAGPPAQRCAQLQCQLGDDFAARSMIDKSEAARGQIECAIRLVAAQEQRRPEVWPDV
jgi:hypothetical protein